MKLVTFADEKGIRLGIVDDSTGIDLAEAAPELPANIESSLAAGEAGWSVVRTAQAKSKAGLPLDADRFEDPTGNPNKILVIGLNYADHVEESGENRQSIRSGSTSSRIWLSALQIRSSFRQSHRALWITKRKWSCRLARGS